VLYVFDEPTIGIHQRDTRRLLNVLQPNELKDSPELVVVLDWAQSKYDELERPAR